MKKLFKYIIGILVIVIIILLIILLNKTNNNNNIIEETPTIIFKLKGKDNYLLDSIDDYEELGFYALLSDGTNIDNYVQITNRFIDENTYEITYTLNYKKQTLSLKRIITIEVNIDTIELSLNGEEINYILIGNKYEELGIKAIDLNDGDISNKVEIDGVVDTSKKGEYEIIYTITNSKDFSKSIKRKVIVYDYDFDIKINNINNKKILTLSSNNDFIKYFNINGTLYEISNNENNYKLVDNTIYNIMIIDKYNNIKKLSYDLKKPIFKCEATLSMTNTSVVVKSDDTSILKYNYYFNNRKYESNKNNYSINGIYKDVSVEAFNTNNSDKITCNIIDNNPTFESGLKTLKYSTWNYYLYVPKNVKKYEKRSLVIFLHGRGEASTNIKSLDRHGFSKYIKEGKEYETFILIPQLRSGETWTKNVDKLMKLIKQVVSEYNIDETRISISGYSLGAVGIPKILEKNPNYFSCAVLIAFGDRGSSYAKYFKDTPTWILYGTKDTFANTSTTKKFIDELKRINNNVEVTVFEGKTHTNIVEATFDDDLVLNWMISNQRKS